jgi:hypothetical protein
MSRTPARPSAAVGTSPGRHYMVQVQVQVCSFTSVCGQVQPLRDVALSNSARHSHYAIAVPGCSSVLAGKLCTNEAIGAAKCSAVNRAPVRMSVPTWPAPKRAGLPEAGVGKMGALQRAMQFIMQCIRGAPTRDTLCVIWELWA